MTAAFSHVRVEMEAVVVLLMLTTHLSLVAGASWVPIRFTITSDNAYAVYAGDASAGPLAYMGSEFATDASEIFAQPEYYPVGPNGKYDPTPATNPMYIDISHSIYIVAWSDAAILQGILFDFVINGVQISPNNPLWQVFPTEFYPQPTGDSTLTPACNPPQPTPFDKTEEFGESFQAPPCPDWVQSQANLADTNNLWRIPTRGEPNTPTNDLYGQQVAGIPTTSRWMWFNSTHCTTTTMQPFDVPDDQCHHGEPLIFRIPAAAFQKDPDACTPKISTGANPHRFCSGQCPFRPDGTAPHCGSVFTTTGKLRECECCSPCEVVVMPDVRENYCNGFCPNCQQCEPSAWATHPKDTSVKYITSCGCKSPNYEGRCAIDRCNNKCIGTCPDPSTPCVPTYNDWGQIESCNCTDPRACRRVDLDSGDSMCTGICETSENPCKGLYYNGVLKDCTCDCCDLIRDETNQVNNFCRGKCDSANLVCNVNRYTTWATPTGAKVRVADGCGCVREAQRLSEPTQAAVVEAATLAPAEPTFAAAEPTFAPAEPTFAATHAPEQPQDA